MYYKDNDFGYVGLDFRDEIWKTGGELVSSRWMKVAQEGHFFRQVDVAKLNFFAFFDETEKYLEMIEDDQVAELYVQLTTLQEVPISCSSHTIAFIVLISPALPEFGN